ncbi:MAG TPA: DNA-formamidopyrimidine glycosylase family protein [Polyangiaceae bacterium]|jgi:formamidopyrimidine-DNA glycosylase
MPELPEVEHARRCLQRWLLDAEVTRAFARPLVGRRVLEVTRRGKWVRVALSEGVLLFSHLGMTGRWVRRPSSAPRERWERGRIDAGDVSARYVDPRRFGKLVVARRDIPAWRQLGPDALEGGLDAGWLAGELARRSRTIKEALMDQGLLAGVGNILATEALWNARLDPRSRTDALSRTEVRAVARGLRAAIAHGLAMQDGDEAAYVQDAGAGNPFRVYGRAGEACTRCGVTLKRVVLGGRGTTFCPGCQVRRRSRA